MIFCQDTYSYSGVLKCVCVCVCVEEVGLTTQGHNGVLPPGVLSPGVVVAYEDSLPRLHTSPNSVLSTL